MRRLMAWSLASLFLWVPPPGGAPRAAEAAPPADSAPAGEEAGQAGSAPSDGPAPAEAAALSGEDDGRSWRTAHVTYLTSRTVYVDAGSAAGIEAGQRLQAVREGVVVAVLEAEFVSSTRTSCTILSGGTGLQVGDTVRFLPTESAAGPAEPGPLPESRQEGSARRRARELGLRGRVGVRYLHVRDGMEGGMTTSQPALDLRLDGSRVAGTGFDVEVDVRSRMTSRSGGDQESRTESRTNVYRMATAWQPEGSPWRLSAGRQFSPSLASVSIFDGVQGEYRRSRWSAGAFSGTQPDPENLGYSSSIREHGGFVQWRNAPEARRRWALTTGVIGSYEEGVISREFGYLQGSFYGERLSLWMSQEVDYNRGWKTEFEDQSVSPTSTFVTMRYKVLEALSVRAGYDNRRNVRLYRDRVTPETEFDDQFRNGVWGGVETRLARHFRAGVDFKTSGGGDLGSADTATLLLGVDRLTRANVYVSTRSTRYTNERVEGWLHSASLGLALGSRWHAEISGGARDEQSQVSPLLDSQVTWLGLELDLALGRGWFLSTSLESSDGDSERLDQSYTSITWRF